MTPTGYATAQKQSLAGRALEREVFARITARLAGAAAGEDASALADALEENRRLWFTLALDLAAPGNQCPDALKAGLLSLAAFVERRTGAVLAGRATADALVGINRDILAGLSAATAATATAAPSLEAA